MVPQKLCRSKVVPDDLGIERQMRNLSQGRIFGIFSEVNKKFIDHMIGGDGCLRDGGQLRDCRYLYHG